MEGYRVDYLRPVVDAELRGRAIDKALPVLRKRKFDAIAVRGMSGATIGAILADRLDKDLYLVRKGNEVESSHSSYKVEGPDGPIDYIIVDDFVATGATIEAVLLDMTKYFPHAKCVGLYLWRDAEFNDHYLTRSESRVADVLAAERAAISTAPATAPAKPFNPPYSKQTFTYVGWDEVAAVEKQLIDDLMRREELAILSGTRVALDIETRK